MSTHALGHLAGTVMANPISPDSLLSGKGALLAVLLIVLAETGLLLGFFLPGDTLLFAAGISSAVGKITTPFVWFLVLTPIAAIAGNLIGYGIGRAAGPRVFDRTNSSMLSPENVERTHRFMEKWGGRSVVIGRFIPLVRTIVPVAAGVGRMPFGKFAFYSVIGGVLWADLVLILGERLGHIHFVQDNKGKIDYLVIGVVILGLLPTIYHWVKARRSKSARQANSAAAESEEVR
jgi:membrane-associated protein